MIIDIHAHLAHASLYPPAFIAGAIEDSLSKVPEEFREVASRKLEKLTFNDPDGQQLIKQMDEASIQKSVMLAVDFGYALGEAEYSIREIYESHYHMKKSFPDRFVLFAGIDPRRGQKGLDLFELAIQEYSFEGLKLYPPCGYEVDDSQLYPYYEICNQKRFPVLIHIGPSLRRLTLEKRYPEGILDVSRCFPNIPFILAHAGVKQHEIGVEVAKSRDNVYLDLSSFQTEINTGSRLEDKIRYVFSEIPEKILFGTDWPMFRLLGRQVTWVDYFKGKGIDEERLHMFFFRNAHKILREA